MEPRESIPSSLPATGEQRRWAGLVVLASAAVFLAVAPFAQVPLAPVPAFIPAYQSALVVNDLITAALLFGQLHFFRSRGLLVLAGGYLFTAFMALAHALTFPGLFAPAGLLGAGPQTTAWIYMFWHSGFPLFVIAYAYVSGEFQRRRSMLLCILATLAAAGLLTAIATMGHDALPAIMSGNRYTSLMIVVVASVWLLSFIAVLVLWRRRPQTVLDVWLMVVMWAWVFDIALAAVLNAGRFDVGFYFGRIYGLVAATLVLIVLLLENGRLYGSLRERSEEAVRARQVALQAVRAKGAFLATMSHEIRTPMGGVLGMLELLALTKLDPRQLMMVGVVRQSGQALMRIIDDILDFSRLEAGKVQLRPEPTAVAAVVEGVRDFYSGSASAKGLALKHFVDPAIRSALWVDSVRLTQILNNLVSNAIKFTAQGEVTIRAELAASQGATDTIRFSVEDTGIGVSPEEAAHLFQPFVQGKGTPTGSGLGLSICRELAHIMGGSLVMDEHRGVGTTMVLTLSLDHADERSEVALDAADGPPAPAARQAATSTRAGSETATPPILVVDDHPINRALLSEQLNAIGYTAETAASGEEAIAKIQAGHFAAIITDCHMTGMSGYDLARRIRSTEATLGSARIPVIACTANVMGDVREACASAGMDDYLTKPVDLARLWECLSRWMSPQVPDPSPSGEAVLGDLGARREVMDQFLSYVDEDSRSLRRAIEARHLEGVVRAAHRVLGASRSIGAGRLADVCDGLEQAARAGDWSAVALLAEPFEVELEHIRSHVAHTEFVK